MKVDVPSGRHIEDGPRHGCRGVIHRARAARERRNRQLFRRLRGAGEMNFAPTMWMESSDVGAMRWQEIGVLGGHHFCFCDIPRTPGGVRGYE
jgi:hypothetical protein